MLNSYAKYSNSQIMHDTVFWQIANKKSREPNCLEEGKAAVRAERANQSQDGRFGNQDSDLMDVTSGVDVGVARGCAANAP